MTDEMDEMGRTWMPAPDKVKSPLSVEVHVRFEEGFLVAVRTRETKLQPQAEDLPIHVHQEVVQSVFDAYGVTYARAWDLGYRWERGGVG